MAEGKLTTRTIENVLITPQSGALDRASADRAIGTVTERMRSLPQVAEVGAPVWTPDGGAVRVPVTMTSDGTFAEDDVPALLDQTAQVQQQYPTLKVEQTGDSSISYQTDEQDGQETAFAEKISLPITLLILMCAFGALIAACVPLLVALSAVVAAIGLSVASSHLFPSVGQNTTMIMLIGMAVGVDYSLFYIRRAREERAKGGGRISHQAAVELAARTSGHAVIVSGIAVVVSVAALFVAGDIIFSSLAVSVMIVVAIAMLASLTVLPALLAKLGRFIDRPRVPLLGRLTEGAGHGRVWRRLLSPALRYPKTTLAVTGALLVALIVPLFGMRLNLPSYDRMPQVQTIQTYNKLNGLFPMQGTTFVVAVRDRSRGHGQIEGAISAVEQAARQDQGLAGDSMPQVRRSTDGRIATIAFGTRLAEDDPATAQLYDRLQNRILPGALNTRPGLDYSVGGTAAMNATDVRHLSSTLPWVVASLLLLTLITMAISFRSLVVGITSAVLNLVSALAALGLLALVFQSDLAAKLLDLPPGGFVISRVPLFLFVILFGLATDYQVFVVSRIREAARTGLSTRAAVAEGVTSSAGVVTSAALVMLSVFTGFVFGGLLEIKQVGFGLAAGVVLDAFVVRIFVLPSLMTLLGRWNWWPSKSSATNTEQPPIAVSSGVLGK